MNHQNIGNYETLKIPFVDLKREAKFFSKELMSETEKVLKSGMYINGESVNQFENSVSEYLKVKYTISVGNGSDALTFILRAIGVSKGDEVICPANSFIATAWAIVAAGAKPVFCDVTKDLLLDSKDFENKISSQTKAVIPVHLTGRVFDMDQISRICNQNNIDIIEDAAQSFGARNKFNQMTGNLSRAGAFSLHPLKNLSIYGDGGLITTNDEVIAEKCRLLRNHGLINRDEAVLWGYNSRLDELQAAFASIKLKNIEFLTKRYIEIAKFYDSKLTNKIKKPFLREEYRDVYHNYVVQVPSKIRNQLQEDLLNNGIDTKIHYPIPLHLQECSKNLGYKKGDFPVSEKLANSMISLPIYPLLERKEIEYISSRFNSLIDQYL